MLVKGGTGVSEVAMKNISEIHPYQATTNQARPQPTKPQQNHNQIQNTESVWCIVLKMFCMLDPGHFRGRFFHRN